MPQLTPMALHQALASLPLEVHQGGGSLRLNRGEHAPDCPAHITVTALVTDGQGSSEEGSFLLYANHLQLLADWLAANGVTPQPLTMADPPAYAAHIAISF